MFIDTHCHLDDEAFENQNEIISNFVSNGGNALITMGINKESSINCKDLAEKYEAVYFGAGFHPSDCDKFNDESVEIIRELAKHEKCVAIGEVGLDYHFEPYDKNKEIEVFVRQIDLASTVNLPLSIHSRDATFDMVNILKERKSKLNSGAVMHCYSGSKETAKILLDLGFYISFSGNVTFKNAEKSVEVVRYIPEDRILVETDSPYLSPHPFRGTRNEPKNVFYVLERVANIRNTNIEILSQKIINNTLGLFKKIKI